MKIYTHSDYESSYIDTVKHCLKMNENVLRNAQVKKVDPKIYRSARGKMMKSEMRFLRHDRRCRTLAKGYPKPVIDTPLHAYRY